MIEHYNTTMKEWKPQIYKI